MQCSKFFQLNCDYVDVNGKSFGEVQAKIEILTFVGNTCIDSLPAFLQVHHPNNEQVRKKLIAHGGIFLTLRGTHQRFNE